jgi:transketolase
MFIVEAIRNAYGQALNELGESVKNLIVLDADVSNSTRSVLFSQSFPQRFINMGIAEANMVSFAAGLSTLGYIPVVNTFSFLLCERALDQIRSSVAYNNLNVKFAANYGGLSDSYDGASHHSISDLAIIRSLPNMTLINISDAVCMRKMLPEIVSHIGPVYFRLCRAETPVIHSENDNFKIGKANIIRQGKDITIFVSGVLLSRAVYAAQMLEKENISAKVVEIHTIKPIDKECVKQCAEETGAVLTVEEGNIFGGLASAVSEIISREKSAYTDSIGINDCFAESGAYEELLDKYGMSVKAIYEKSKKLLKLKEGVLL